MPSHIGQHGYDRADFLVSEAHQYDVPTILIDRLTDSFLLNRRILNLRYLYPRAAIGNMPHAFPSRGITHADALQHHRLRCDCPFARTVLHRTRRTHDNRWDSVTVPKTFIVYSVNALHTEKRGKSLILPFDMQENDISFPKGSSQQKLVLRALLTYFHATTLSERFCGR